MTRDRMSIAAVSPARNERANIERLAACMIEQQHRPSAWVIVDDGSQDGTRELSDELAASHPWIQVTETGEAAGVLAHGRRTGRALDSFRTGVRALRVDADIVMKIDADTSFEPDYLGRLADRFAECPDLGIAGGVCYELEDGSWVPRSVLPTHPRGASRAYRRDCLDTVMTLESRMGWDGLDEAKARLLGFRSETVTDLAFRHHRQTGGRERGRLQHFSAQGRAAWYMGYRPSYLALRTLYRMREEPAAVGMLWGYTADAAARRARYPEPEVRREVRSEQRLSRVLGREAGR